MLGNIPAKNHVNKFQSSSAFGDISAKQTINLGPTEYSANAAVNTYLNQ